LSNVNYSSHFADHPMQILGLWAALWLLCPFTMEKEGISNPIYLVIPPKRSEKEKSGGSVQWPFVSRFGSVGVSVSVSVH